MSNTKFHNLFSVPFYSTILDESIIKKVQNKVVPKLHLLNDLTPKISNQKTDFHADKKIVDLDELPSLLDKIGYHLYEFTQKFELPLYNSMKYWVQNYEKGDFHTKHSHPHSIISGVYYVQANKNAGKIIFYNPNPHILNSINISGEVEYKKQHFDIKPKSGLLILFPSYLIHKVVESKKKNTIRTCIAFNINR